MAWLSGWDNRIKLTIDNTKIDSELSHFPVTVVLSSTHGDCVFDELTSNANRTKIAFTKSDGTTQLYGEIEEWDDANESAVIHVSLSGWSISSSADTDFYMYYDSGHAANTTYIGDIDSTPGHSVWDSNFKFVCHMVDATTSTVKDSTSNGNDGTKGAANNPIEATGKIGKGQDFGGHSSITFSSYLFNANADYTIFVIFNQESYSFKDVLFHQYPYYNHFLTFSDVLTNDDLSVRAESDSSWDNFGRVLEVPFDTYKAVTFTRASDYSYGFNDGVKGTGYAVGTFGGTGSGGSTLGYFSNRGFYGIIDECRISNSARSDAWIKATYNTLWDTLLTYGSEETDSGGVTENAVFFGMAF